MNKTKKLTEKEAEIMERLWADGPMTVRELLERYDDPRPHFNTVSTIVRILVDKGFVEHVGQKNGAYLYGASVKPADFGRRSLAQVVKSYFNNSYSSVVSALVKEEKISVEELREIIDMIEKHNEK
jgi:Predicted transcriptional regulator